MSMFSKKYDEDEMFQMLNELLMGGESITTALYCVFKDTGFFASSRRVAPGYVALTDRDRLVGLRMDIFGTKPVYMELNFLTKIKISTIILGQKIIYLRSDEGKKNEVKFQYAPKVFGSQGKFPNQEQYSDILLDELRARKNRL